jgi:16S rRNA C967 or C1407 C5-methylase (RsmB/RsmF family)
LATSTLYELSEALAAPYYLDRASIVAARALDVRPGHDVTDLCAAPGGKTLVIALALAGRGTLTANERSSARRARLHRVLETHLPDPLRVPVTVTGHDATRWGIHNPTSADKVLADVPCSSERHVIASAKALSEWSESRTRRLAQQAYAIACAGADALRPGGEMLYSTCALSPLENDQVIGKLAKRGGTDLEIVDLGQRLEALPADLTSPHGELSGLPTAAGWLFLPDLDDGMGPMFISLVRKRD